MINQQNLKSNLKTMVARSVKAGDQTLSEQEVRGTIGYLLKQPRRVRSQSSLFNFSKKFNHSIPVVRRKLIEKFPVVMNNFFPQSHPKPSPVTKPSPVQSVAENVSGAASNIMASAGLAGINPLLFLLPAAGLAYWYFAKK